VGQKEGHCVYAVRMSLTGSPLHFTVATLLTVDKHRAKLTIQSTVITVRVPFSK
jgi:hypothetical protein